MLIALRSPKGAQRLELQETEKLSSVYAKAAAALGLPEGSFHLCRQQNGRQQLPSTHTKSLSSLGVRHGDSLFVRLAQSAASGEQAVATEQEDDPLDRELDKADGRVIRQRDERLCRHAAGARCIHCAPLEPFDAAYLGSLDPPVKYLPFHAYLRKIQAGKYSGALGNVSVRKRANCRNHEPGGICSSCMPEPLTLELQSYRHTDYLQFEHHGVVDRFVDFWRRSGHQRAGLLVGRYERHDGISLGIKAVVAAIYEPPQESKKHSLCLLDDPNREKLERLLRILNLQLVGWVFSDLLPSDEPGKVRHFRGSAATFFLSAEEAITAGHFQLQHPNRCSRAEGGVFGSKFVTCVLTGDPTNQIAPSAYQLSNQGMALVRDELLVPTFDAPELAWCRERTREDELAPDVFYSATNEYKSPVKRLARPLPVEFLITDMPVGVAKDSSEHTCTFQPGSAFPIENRAELGEVANSGALRQALESCDDLSKVLCDFHLLLYLYTDPVVAFSDEEMRAVAAHALAGDASACREWAERSPCWEVARAVAFSQPAGGWQCKHCTFHNSSAETAACEMCGLPQ